MKIKCEERYVTKASGLKVRFDGEKFRRSLLRAGADPVQAAEILFEISSMLTDEMSTKKIYRMAFRLLRGFSRPTAARYKLKRGILHLGSSGFAFERFSAEILEQSGYRIQVGVIVSGRCVSHELDIIAEKGDQHFMVECKFHNTQGRVRVGPSRLKEVMAESFELCKPSSASNNQK
ncbi:restriction endonuclease [Parapedobacter sp. ISTM3]|uniref:restriction endonuclease n=1 Tax=Parapedobacter sp. ISTM3 TaxID=2800130 RepID=UPI0019051439|nr:restriction endonuclease [Parapedobacter sp. ISTM3]MBK1439871.1 restriction endonuclease [Parapedobacter sp. ISTM3]